MAHPISMILLFPRFTIPYIGLPIYRGGFPRYNSLDNILNPRPSLPLSAITRDPFWYDLGDVGLRPFGAHIPSNDLPSYLRESYLSPIKRRYLWTKHPIRPFGKFSFKWISQQNFCWMICDCKIFYIYISNLFQRISCKEDILSIL